MTRKIRFARVVMIGIAALVAAKDATQAQTQTDSESPEWKYVHLSIGGSIMKVCSDIWAMSDANDVSGKSKEIAENIDSRKRDHVKEYNGAVADLIKAKENANDISNQIARATPGALIEAGASPEIDMKILSDPAAMRRIVSSGAEGLKLQALEVSLKLAEADVQKAEAAAFVAVAQIAELNRMRGIVSECVQEQLDYVKGLAIKESGSVRISRAKLPPAAATPTSPNSGGFGLEMHNMSPEDTAQEKAAVAGAVNARGNSNSR